jgi:hypothetical protein
MKSIEQQLSEAQDSIKSLNAVIATKDTEIKTLNESIAASKKEAAKRDLEGQIKEAKLTEAATKVVMGQFEAGLLPTPELVKASIEAFKEAVPATKVRTEKKNGGIQESAPQKMDEAARVKQVMKDFRFSEKEARLYLGLD